MIDENEDCVTKSKLSLTVKIFRKYNDRSRVEAKETNGYRDTEIGDHLGRKTNIKRDTYK